MSSVRIAEALAHRGIEVTVITPGRGEREERNGVSVIRVPIPARWNLLRAYRPWTSAVVRVIEALKPDVVHAQGLPLAAFAAAAWRKGPRVITVHGHILRDAKEADPSTLDMVRATVAFCASSRKASRFDAVIGVHPDWRVNLACRPHSFVYIPNIVSDDFYKGRRPDPAPRVLYAGGSRLIKGADVLLRAWPSVQREIPNAELELVGWTPAMTSVLPDMSGVHFRPHLAPLEMRRVMDECSVLVIPSRYEVAPLILGEAWAARLPVVATQVGGLATLAEGAALVVTGGDPVSLANAITGALRAPETTVDIVNEGARRAEAWCEEVVANAHLDLYRRVAAQT